MSFQQIVEENIRNRDLRVLGENGHPALSLEGLGDKLVGLFFGLVRNKSEGILEKEIKMILEGGDKEEIKNLFLIAFQTRWCRGGKGEKKLFYIMFSVLLDKYYDLCFELLELIPTYGTWKDFRSLYFYIYSRKGNNLFLFMKMNDILEKQLRSDINELDKSDGLPKISLLAKYYSHKKCFTKKVSEDESDKKGKKKEITEKSLIENRFFSELSERLYNPSRSILLRSRNYAEMKLRKKLVALRRALDIPEVKMSANKWAEINFSKVASLCLSRNTRAFLDEDKDGNIKHPDNSVRQCCRENLIESLSKGVKGCQVQPNELVEKVLNDKKVSVGVAAVVNSQWESLLKSVKEQIEKRVKETGKNNFDLSKCIVMSDVSGSMAGTPMMVSIGFGILVSQLAHESFRDLVLTFDSEPVFHSLRNEKTFVKKVQSLQGAPWGGSTNFEAAMNLIVDIILENKLSESEIPQSLLVVSDMQFNDATGASDYEARPRFGWGTAYDNIRNMFKRLGEKLYGRVVEPPQIIFWNVREDTVGFPAGADEEGVTLLSGYSPALLKFIFSGELQEDVEVADEKGETKMMKVKSTPKDTLKKILGESGLDPVRVILEKYFEKM